MGFGMQCLPQLANHMGRVGGGRARVGGGRAGGEDWGLGLEARVTLTPTPYP